MSNKQVSDGNRTPGIKLGLRHEKHVPLYGPASNEFELASALRSLLIQASQDENLAEGALKGAEVSEPALAQSSFYQSVNLTLEVGSKLFRVRVMKVPQ
jgi:hypothetical protein